MFLIQSVVRIAKELAAISDISAFTISRIVIHKGVILLVTAEDEY